MIIVQIEKQKNGSHNNQITSATICLPEGWAIVPDDLETPNFPFGDITVEQIDNIMTVTSWIPNEIPGQSPTDLINEAKTTKIAEIKQSCEDYIYAGADVTYSDNTTEHFTYSLADQSNISEMFTAIMAGATEYPYHADGEICKIYSKEQIVTIYGTLSLFKTEATTYHNSLKAQVNAMTDVDAIIAVKFKETELTGEYLENYAAMMASAKAQLEAILARIPTDETTTA